MKGENTMKSILEQLYAGELYPSRRAAPLTEEYKDSYDAFCTGRETLSEWLHEVEPEMETKLSNMLDELEILGALDREDMFYYGLSLGMQLLSEALFFA